jgi:hypothetical protein
MIGRLGGLFGAWLLAGVSCGSGSRPPEQSGEQPGGEQPGGEPEVSNPDPHDGEPPLSCSMAGQACPSAGLPRFSSQLDQAGWVRLRALAEDRVVAVVLGDRVELIESCRLPGRYHEGAPAPDSPGRAWSSDRLVFVPGEVVDCGRATHFVASFAIAGEADGEAIALPLPCPPLGSGKPSGCIGAGLDDEGRKHAAKPLWEATKPLLDNREMDGALPLALDIAALLPDGWGYLTLLDALRPLDQQTHGGCLWLSEAVYALHEMLPDHEVSIVDVSGGRIAPSHEYPTCDTRPSLLTCFPKRFRPGTGDNCW